MKPLLLIVATLASLATFTPALCAQPAPPDLVQQVQAADLLADLMTYTVDRADVRLQDAQSFLAKIGKQQDFEKAKPAVASPHRLNYMLLFRGSLMFVEGDGAKYADPEVKDQPPTVLFADLTAAQYYNMDQFLHFNQQRQQFASIRAYLKSIGEYDNFVKETTGKGATTEPAEMKSTPTTPQEVAKRMGEMLSFIHETAWKEAQAKGMTREQFDQQWPQQVRDYRQSVMARIDGITPGDNTFGHAQLAGSTAPPPSTPAVPLPPHYDTPRPDLGADRTLPPPVPSPYSNQDYRDKDLSLWDMWDYNPQY